MNSVNYFDGLILGKGTKVKELLNNKFTQEEVVNVVRTTGMSVDDVMGLSETQFEAILKRIKE